MGPDIASRQHSWPAHGRQLRGDESEGMGYATGAMLATGRRELTPQLLLSPECSQDGKIALPVDHWLVCMHEKQLLSIGHACPSVFHQRLGGTHAEQSADDSGIEKWYQSGKAKKRRSKREMRHKTSRWSKREMRHKTSSAARQREARRGEKAAAAADS